MLCLNNAEIRNQREEVRITLGGFSLRNDERAIERAVQPFLFEKRKLLLLFSPDKIIPSSFRQSIDGLGNSASAVNEGSRLVRKRSASQRRELALLLPTALSTVKSRNLSNENSNEETNTN